MLQGYTVGGPKWEGRKKHCLSQCTSGGYRRGSVGIAHAGDHIAGGCRRAGMVWPPSTGTDKTLRTFGKRRDSARCATWRLTKLVYISSLCRLRTLLAQHCSLRGLDSYHTRYLVPNIVRSLRSLSRSASGQG
jgi:hypothetical protein